VDEVAEERDNGQSQGRLHLIVELRVKVLLTTHPVGEAETVQAALQVLHQTLNRPDSRRDVLGNEKNLNEF